MVLTIGLPRMHKEAGERRDFLPALVSFLERIGAERIVVEAGYGSGMNLTKREYLAASTRCCVGTQQECFEQDVVLVLRYPADTSIAYMRPGAILMSMVHFPTRPARVEHLARAGIRAVSLDSITDDRGRRLVENLEAVAWNGVREGFRALGENWPELERPGRGPVRVVILGGGAVGGHAVRAAVAYGDRAMRARLTARGVAGVEVTVVDYDLADRVDYMAELLARSDLIVDATQRRDTTRPVIPNRWLGAVPEHAVLVDLAVDPYDFTQVPPHVKGIEGIPEGNLDQHVFRTEDAAWAKLDPRVDTRQRRTALSCYSWPGIEPRDCMEVYGKQVEPLLRVLFERELDALDESEGTYFERAVARAELNRWRKRNTH